MMIFESLFQDLRYGAHTLFRNVGLTAVSVFALALGIGVNTVAFTAYKAFIARPLDARDPGRMVNFALRLEDGADRGPLQLSGLRGLSGPSALVQGNNRF